MASIIDKVLGTGPARPEPGGAGQEGDGGTVVLPPRAKNLVEVAWLAILRSPDLKQKGELIAIDRELVISRLRTGPQHKDPSAGGSRIVEIDDPYVSSPHLFIHPPTAEERAFSVEPNPDAKNPARHNDSPLEPGVRTPVEDGDMLQLGLTQLCFKRATIT